MNNVGTKSLLRKFRIRWRVWWHSHLCQHCVDCAAGGGACHVILSWDEVGWPAKLFANQWRNWGRRNFPLRHPGYTRRQQRARRRAWVAERMTEDRMGLPTYTLEYGRRMRDGDRMTVFRQNGRLYADIRYAPAKETIANE